MRERIARSLGLNKNLANKAIKISFVMMEALIEPLKSTKRPN